MEYKEISGNLIHLAVAGEFDVITHGCNCFCTMGAGIAPQMAAMFRCDEFPLEHIKYRGDLNKLGQINYVAKRLVGKNNFDAEYPLSKDKKYLHVVNSYTQYMYGPNHTDGHRSPVDYDAIVLCMRKINHIFKGLHIGLPQIGCGLAGGDWEIVKGIIQRELKDCNVTVVIYDQS
jgi:O-acetyl-ADP-ribose deacetylase (regulator of RNase III)